jgi:alkanesulfonate monooxygenase SsuD/methylene tetrahydromethanopterin reductase-like flavin-dependent oxidoreductase (luciferase family)
MMIPDLTENAMDLSLFQLLPAPDHTADREVIAQAWWEIDTAEAAGFDCVWLTEHHLSSFGLIGTPSVFAAAIAQRTRRIKIGYAVAVVPLHHPVRLAEEIAWLDALSQGRVLVGLGPGFSPFEFGAYGIPLEERHERLAEGGRIVRGLLTEERFGHAGRFWSVPTVTLRPRPTADFAPRFYRASSSAASLREAPEAGTPVLLGLKPAAELAEAIAAYRSRREELGVSATQVEREVAEFRVLRRVCVAPTDEEAWREARSALAWENATARNVHEGGQASSLADGSPTTAPISGAAIGTTDTVVAELTTLRQLGLRHVIAWINFGDLPYTFVRRSLELLAHEVAPRLLTTPAPGTARAGSLTQSGR